MKFGKFIQQKRREKNIQLEEFAKDVCYSADYLEIMESGIIQSPIDLNFVERIIAALNLEGMDKDEAFVRAGFLPPDMQADLENVVHAYRFAFSRE